LASAGLLAVTAGALVAGGATPAHAIAGGEKASADAHPWLGAIRNPAAILIGRPAGQICAGTLVTPTKMVTAAHCFDFGTLGVSVTFGRTDMRGSNGTTVKVKRVWKHPDYKSIKTPKKASLTVNDVAVVTLEKPVQRQTLPLISKDEGGLYEEGTEGTIAGWGDTTPDGGTTGVLHAAKVPTVSDARCNEAYGSDYPGIVCAGDWAKGGVDSCMYDSGGPLVINGRIAGVVSGGGSDADGEKCAQPHFPGIYTRLSTYQDALQKEIATP
jgi:secreted trypsin-like serine protease